MANSQSTISDYSDFTSTASLKECKENPPLPGISQSLDFPKIRPENAVRSYLYSKCYTNQLHPNTLTVNDPSLYSIKAQKLHNIRRQENVTKTLKIQKALAIDKQKKFDEEWNKLRMIEARLQDDFKAFNDFIAQNQEKKKRMAVTIEYHKTLVAETENKTKKLQKKYADLQKIKSQMEEKIKGMSMYENYLQSVCKMSYTFHHVNDIIEKYEAILISQEIIYKRYEHYRNELEKYRNQFTKMISEKSDKYMYLQTHLVQLIVRCKDARLRSAQWEKTVSTLLDVCCSIKKDHVRTKLDCETLYNELTKHIEIEEKETSYKGQLQFIKHYLEKLNNAVNFVHRDDISL